MLGRAISPGGVSRRRFYKGWRTMNDMIGVVENCTASRINGFVCVAKGTDFPVLNVYVNSNNVGVAAYDGERAASSGLGSCVCMDFHFEFSECVIGKKVVRVKFAGGRDLSNSPFVYCTDSLRNVFANVGEIKAALSLTFLSGEGIEIGALSSPFPVKAGVVVRNVDRMDVDSLRKQYPELADKDLAKVDIVDDGETLGLVGNESQQFVVASHFVEHAKNPIGFYLACSRVLRKGGVLLLVVPDKRHTFDVDRPLTSIEHVIGDHTLGHEAQKRTHCEEIVCCQQKLSGDAAEIAIERMLQSDYSYHWHVWTSNTFLECMAAVIARYSMPLEIVLFMKGKGEFFVVLMKS
jgi:SAM-dependent methyltransferase